jgi:hypothetical protein
MPHGRVPSMASAKTSQSHPASHAGGHRFDLLKLGCLLGHSPMVVASWCRSFLSCRSLFKSLEVGLDASKVAVPLTYRDHGDVAQVERVHGCVVDVIQESVAHEDGFERPGEAL